MAANDRPGLLLAHYFGGSARSWSPLVTALDGRCDCIVPDLPGFGDTRSLPGEASLGAYAEQLCGLKPERSWIAVGHSMGGKIALAAALHRPPNLVGMILIATSPPTPEPISDEERAKTLAAFGSRAAAEMHLRTIADDRLPRDILATCVEDQLRVDQSVWNWWLERGSRDDISNAAAKLSLPVLVVTGDNDTVLGHETAPAVAAGLQNATLEIIASGGHLVPLEQPDAVAAAIVDFVGDLSSGAGQ